MRALGVQLSVRSSVKRQIQKAFAGLNGNVSSRSRAGSSAVASLAHVKPRAKLQNAVRQSARANDPKIRNSTPTPSRRRSQAAAPSRAKAAPPRKAGRSLGNSNRKVNAGGDARNRKSIANTQADKKGTDSGGMTSLQTSGIDGKGLKINQIR